MKRKRSRKLSSGGELQRELFLTSSAPAPAERSSRHSDASDEPKESIAPSTPATSLPTPKGRNSSLMCYQAHRDAAPAVRISISAWRRLLPLLEELRDATDSHAPRQSDR